jgi:hypothetical protein
MKNLVLIFLIVLTIGCSKNKDPFQNTDLGSIKYEEFKSEMIKKNLFTELNKDTTTFRYYIIDNKKKYSTEIYINSDGYSGHANFTRIIS